MDLHFRFEYLSPKLFVPTFKIQTMNVTINSKDLKLLLCKEG